MKHAWRYGSASATAEFYEGLGLVELRGPITIEAITKALIDIVRSAPASTCVYVFCWDRAALATSIDEILAVTATAVFCEFIRLPMAMVVSDAQADDFNRYAFNRIQFGFVRVVFSELQDALRWASRKIAFSELACASRPRLPTPRLRASDSVSEGSRHTM